MYFAYPLVLFGLLAAAIPVLIHLLTRRQAKRIPWGAMQFLLGSFVGRNRKLLLEETLLMICRCCLLALVALALAMPMVKRDSNVAWPLLLPVLLLAIGLIGAGVALGSLPRWRIGLIAAGVLLLVGTLTAAVMQQMRGAAEAPTRARQHVAVLIDASPSMQLSVAGKSNFQRAKEAAVEIVKSLPAGDAASLVIAGNPPQMLRRSPTSRREDFERALDGATPSGGTLSVVDSLRAAASTLAESEDAARKVVLITDGQRAGWAEGEEILWPAIAKELEFGEAESPLVVYRLPAPKQIRNVQVREVVVTPASIGAGCEAEIKVRVVNTGTVDINEGFDVVLEVDGAGALDQRIVRLAAGATESVTFHHQFATSGLRGIEARIELGDDLPFDDRAAQVVRVHGGVPVLLVEGDPAPRFLDRTSAFLEVALSSTAGTIQSADPTKVTQESATGLFALTSIDLAALAKLSSVDGYRIVVLSDVARVPINAAVAIKDFVEAGGSLLVIPGSQCQADAYNEWMADDGETVLPAKLLERHLVAEGDKSVGIALGSLNHVALQMVADSTKSDLDTAAFTAYWKLDVDKEDKKVRVGGTLETGDPLLVERRLGRGKVILLSCSLDRRGGNLPALQSYLPFVHELMQNLVHLPPAEMTIGPAGGEVRLLASRLAARRAGESLVGAGLRGEYFTDDMFSRSVSSRLDPTIDFQWQAAAPTDTQPADKFSIRWTGTLTPALSGKTKFFLKGNAARLWIDGQDVADTGEKGMGEGELELVGGRRYALRIDYQDRTPESECRLLWSQAAGEPTPIPSDVLSPGEAWRNAAGELALSKNDTARLLARGKSSPVVLSSVGKDLFAEIGPQTLSGLDRIELPSAMVDDFRDETAGGGIPLAVVLPADESRMAMLNDADVANGREQMSLLVTRSMSDVEQALQEDQPANQPLWRYLLAAALALAVLEIALTRWIAVQRRIGETSATEFVSQRSTPPIAPRSQIWETLRANTSERSAGSSAVRETEELLR